MLKLKHQYFWHLMRRADSLEKTLMLGKIEGRRRRGRQRTRWLYSITDSVDMSLNKFPSDCRGANWYRAGPVGLPGTKTFCVPHFFDYRKQPSFSLHDCPWVTKGRFKQLLIRKGRGWKIKEKQSWAALGQGSVFPIKGYTQQYLWTILQILKPPQVKEDNN